MFNQERYHEACREMSAALMNVLDVSFDDTSELQRQLLAAFTFGMLYAEGQINGAQPNDVQAGIIAVLCQKFKYSEEQAADFSSFLIEVAADKSVHDTIHAIIHRGIDGHRQWQAADHALLKKNIEEVFAIVQGG